MPFDVKMYAKERISILKMRRAYLEKPSIFPQTHGHTNELREIGVRINELKILFRKATDNKNVTE